MYFFFYFVATIVLWPIQCALLRINAIYLCSRVALASHLFVIKASTLFEQLRHWITHTHSHKLFLLMLYFRIYFARRRKAAPKLFASFNLVGISLKQPPLITPRFHSNTFFSFYENNEHSATEHFGAQNLFFIHCCCCCLTVVLTDSAQKYLCLFSIHLT